FFDYRSQIPGARHRITTADLPPPYTAPIPWDYRPNLPAEWPNVPAGFTVDRYASVDAPRILHRAPNGDVFVAEMSHGRIRVLRDRFDGTPPRLEIFASGLRLPYGLAFFPLDGDPRYLYVGTADSVVRFRYRNGDLHARGPAEVVVPGLPTEGHTTRDIAVSLDERSLYIAVGSAANATHVDASSIEVHPANILQPGRRGRELLILASRLRNH